MRMRRAPIAARQSRSRAAFSNSCSVPQCFLYQCVSAAVSREASLPDQQSCYQRQYQSLAPHIGAQCASNFQDSEKLLKPAANERRRFFLVQELGTPPRRPGQASSDGSNRRHFITVDGAARRWTRSCPGTHPVPSGPSRSRCDRTASPASRSGTTGQPPDRGAARTGHYYAVGQPPAVPVETEVHAAAGGGAHSVREHADAARRAATLARGDARDRDDRAESGGDRHTLPVTLWRCEPWVYLYITDD